MSGQHKFEYKLNHLINNIRTIDAKYHTGDATKEDLANLRKDISTVKYTMLTGNYLDMLKAQDAEYDAIQKYARDSTKSVKDQQEAMAKWRSDLRNNDYVRKQMQADNEIIQGGRNQHGDVNESRSFLTTIF